MWVGQREREVHKTWILTQDENKKLDRPTIFTKFIEHVQPKLNSVFKRYEFNIIVQKQLSLEDFLTTLRISTADCTFTNKEKMIQDRIMFGLTSNPRKA